MGEDFVRVFSSHSWLQSEIVKGRLEAEGIPVQLTGEQDGPYPVDPAELSVPSSFEAQARRVLGEIERGSFEVSDQEADAEKKRQDR